ncbi:hypothetical protein J2810_002902 [Chryseobacterium rhizosphaerae]|nr:hypothetical protein [Chryseobacterium rhizosphaerae]
MIIVVFSFIYYCFAQPHQVKEVPQNQNFNKTQSFNKEN